MRLLIPCLFLSLAACSPPQPADAPALSFRADPGGALKWSFAGGITGALLLSQQADDTSWRPVLVLSCDTARTGGVQARGLLRAEPSLTMLEVRAGEAVMSVPGRPDQIGDQPVLQGDGDLPPNWAEALAAAKTLALRYGDQGLEVQGPGAEEAGRFGRYCATLDGRAR